MRERSIHFSKGLWERLLAELRLRGGGRHEAGAFLLGPDGPTRREITHAVHYDDLDPNAYSTGVCVLYADAFEQLWRFCRGQRLRVIADIHTHPRGAGQSQSDCENPMVACDGHIAIIVPHFAKPPVWRHRLGIYRYRGSHEWTDLSGWSARRLLRTGTGR